MSAQGGAQPMHPVAEGVCDVLEGEHQAVGANREVLRRPEVVGDHPRRGCERKLQHVMPFHEPMIQQTLPQEETFSTLRARVVLGPRAHQPFVEVQFKGIRFQDSAYTGELYFYVL